MPGVKRIVWVAAIAIVGCGAGEIRETRVGHGHAHAHGGEREAADAIEVVESWPAETTLDHADVRDASEVWPEMIGRAKKTIDFAEFYASEAEGAFHAQSKLAKVIDAIEAAVARKVRVRFLVDASFADKYPDTLARLEKAGVTVRRFDVGKAMGGVLHAKYFVVDGEEVFVGSQNFDWRALGHIQEIGVRLRGPGAALATSVFELDWATAAGEQLPSPPMAAIYGGGDASGAEAMLAASPDKHLPVGAPWDLPMLVSRITTAKRWVRVQLLTYGTKNRDGSTFTTLDDALRAAAARGVKVELLVSHWALKHPEPLEALAKAGVEVRVITIPPWSGGEIPFARVAHAKYALFDTDDAWVGTSNWEGDYFLRSRNLSVFVKRSEVPAKLARVFADGWASRYTKPLRSR